ncbi:MULTISPECIES: hypothetical protein [unclassified Streptomyces]|uniref:hypothetical protein n=1 Tax=unclassified Streptomyces TaxID=2593676 RepID=UPI002E18FFDE|nr:MULTISPECIES: hypothetical protein [unclassified Streptomyces]
MAARNARRSALAHLARHAQSCALPAHLRTCQCRERGCGWHRRHRGCHGPVRLALTGDHGGTRWRLADVCTDCAAATAHTALVPESTHRSPDAGPRSRPNPAPHGTGFTDADAQARVRQTLVYLASALPQSCSPGARLLALQCALRTNEYGEVCLPAGLLRGMRLHQRADLWEELEYAYWLRRDARRPVRARLLDAAMQAQSNRPRRARAAHWALHPLPRYPVPHTLPCAARFAALVLAAHTRPDGTGTAERDLLTHLCGQATHQLSDLFDQLTRARFLFSWHDVRVAGEVLWQLGRPPSASLDDQSRDHSCRA